jgi:alpha-amylase
MVAPLSGLEGNNSAGVIFQGFYWDVPEGWYGVLADAASDLSDIGGYSIDYIWFPPPSKGMSGSSSMGYDPYDYYDLGQYDQKGSVETRFGSFNDLQDAIYAYHSNGIGVIADVVINHRGGGELEHNPNTGDYNYTDFGGVASRNCTWGYDAFHPSSYEAYDPGNFGGFPDVCHANATVIDDLTEWGNWLAGLGFGGWRFDYVKGYYPWVAEEFKNSTGDPFCVAEFWDRDINLIEQWVDESGGGISVFDFPLYYSMRDVCLVTDGSADISTFVSPYSSFVAIHPELSVTFAASHDTDEITYDKMLAYGFILTYEGTPCIWWKDYFDYGLDVGGAKEPLQEGNGIDRLIWVRGALGGGAPETEVLYKDGDLLAYQETAHEGYVVVLNDNSKNWKGQYVETRFADSDLECVAWSSTVDNSKPASKTTNSEGGADLWAPPRGYAVYAPVQ